MLTPDPWSVPREVADPAKMDAASQVGRVRGEVPEVVIAAADDSARSLRAFAAWIADMRLGRTIVITSRHGARFARSIHAAAGVVTPSPGAGRGWVDALLGDGRLDVETVVGIGGGRCLDLAKGVATGLRVPLVAVPTQLSHDGICSPVAVLPSRTGCTDSIPATAPRAVYFSLYELAQAPTRSLRAGVADLLTNPFALRDWELAAVVGRDVIHDEAWHLSLEAFGMIEPSLDALDEDRLRSATFLGLLCHAIANSGAAMMLAGSSRPASGAEHKISHAIDLLYGGRALHGEQVALASLIAVTLHGLDPAPLRDLLVSLRLPSHPDDIGLTREELVAAVLAAPATRPGRYTILEKADLDAVGAREVISSIWGSL